MGCGTVNRGNENISENVKKADLVMISGPREENEKIMFDRDVAKEGQLMSNRKGKPIELPKEKVKKHWIFQVEETTSNEAFIVRPWQGVLKIPEDFKPAPSPSQYSIEPIYIYGYQSSESRNNLFFTPEPSSIVFPAGIFGVVYNYTSDTQLIYKNHEDEIVSLAYHNTTQTVATGDKRFKICIWSSATLATYKQHKTQAKGTLSLSFCPNSDLLAVLSGDFKLTIYKWVDFSVIYQVAFNQTVFFATVHDENLSVCVVGQKFVGFVSKNGVLEAGSFGDKGKICTMTSAVWNGEYCLTAATNGQVYRWRPPLLEAAFQVFELGVTVHAIKVKDLKIFCTGADRSLVVLGSQMEILNRVVFSAYAKAIDLLGDRILLGLVNGSIGVLEGWEFQEVFMGFPEEIVDIISLPPISIVIGLESEIRLIDIQRHKLLCKIPHKNLYDTSHLIKEANAIKIKSLDYNSTFNHLAISISAGFLSIYHYTSIFRHFLFLQLSETQIDSVKFSPDGSMLICCSLSSIKILSAPSYSIKMSLNYNFRVKSIDWTRDSTRFQTSAENFDLKFWTVNGEELSDLNETLATWNSKVGWPLRNLNESFIDLSHITSAHCSPAFELIATGDDWGNIRVFEVLAEVGTMAKCHASHVRNVKWGGAGVFSGGNLCVVESRVRKI